MHSGIKRVGGRGSRACVQVGWMLVVLTAVAPTHGAVAAEPGAPSTRALQRAQQGPRRELQRRTLRITDASIESVSELHVAEGSPTTVLFEVPVKQDGVILADFKGAFYP